ncbi:MAG: hypothetical protein WDN46_14050 [Methylocella sp.]
MTRRTTGPTRSDSAYEAEIAGLKREPSLLEKVKRIVLLAKRATVKKHRQRLADAIKKSEDLAKQLAYVNTELADRDTRLAAVEVERDSLLGFKLRNEILRDKELIARTKLTAAEAIISAARAAPDAVEAATDAALKFVSPAPTERARDRFAEAIQAALTAANINIAAERACPTDADSAMESCGQTDFVETLQGHASFCESCARDGGMKPDDIAMVVGKLRDAAFVVSQLQKLRDELRERAEKAETERDTAIEDAANWREALSEAGWELAAAQPPAEFATASEKRTQITDGLKRGEVLSFVDGVLTVNVSGYGSNNGDGYLGLHDDNLSYEEDGIRRAKIPNSELIAIRDFLNRVLPLAAPVDGESKP